MGRKSKSKEKSKSQKYKMVVDGKIIDLRRYAYELLACSGKMFGIPDECIPTCEIEENEYPLSNYITVFSNMLCRVEIAYRNVWYEQFTKHYELTKFSSFSDVRRALGEVISSEMFLQFPKINLRMTSYLTATSEILLFIFTKNCNLFFNELCGYWADCVLTNSKLFVKHGGLAGAYKRFNNPHFQSEAQFLNKFIQEWCIPYRMTPDLVEIYKKSEEIYKNSLKSSEKQESSTENMAFMLNIIERNKTLERPQASGTSIPINTGLGIIPHEQWLQSESPPLDVDIDTSFPNVSSTSSRETASNRRPSNRKEKLRRKPNSQTSEKPSEHLSSAIAAALPQNFPIASCQKNTKDYKESMNEDNRKKSSLLQGEGIKRLTSNFISSVTVSPQSLSGTSEQEHLRDRKYPSSQKKTEKKKSSSRPTGDLQQLNIGGATSAMSPPILSGTSRRKTDRDSDSRLEESLRQLSLRFSKRDTPDEKQK